MDSESGSTSSEWKAERKGGSVRMLAKRPNGQLRERVTQLMEGKSDGKSYLETVAISERARDNYRRHWLELQTMAQEQSMDLSSAQEVDKFLVDLFNAKYLAGEGPHYGDYLLASLMDMKPEYSRLGDKRLPRSWRALKGWRKLCPARSRQAYPLAVWCGLSWRMVAKGHVTKALSTCSKSHLTTDPGRCCNCDGWGLCRPRRV